MSGQLYATGALHRMVRYNARAEILDSIGDMSDITVFGNQILAAPYIPSGLMWSDRCGFPAEERLSIDALVELQKSGKTFLNPTLAKEGLFQGKVLLVLKVGDEPKLDIKPGEWIWTLQENTRQISISLPHSKKSRVLEMNGIDHAAGWICKLLYDTDVYGRVSDPDILV